MTTVTLYSRPGCHLCDEARAILDRMRERTPFEVDEIRSRNEWKSVVVRGTIYFLDPAAPAHDRAEYNAALERLRTADPTALTDEDFAPHRRALFRIHADEITGRRASPR